MYGFVVFCCVFAKLWKVFALFAEISIFLKKHCFNFQKKVPLEIPAAHLCLHISLVFLHFAPRLRRLNFSVEGLLTYLF